MPFDAQDMPIKVEGSSTSTTFLPETLSNASPFTYERGFKRALDVSLVLLGSIVVLPLIALMALLVSLDGHSPFYVQSRVGRNGKVFKIFKMRTMVHDADRLLKEQLSSEPSLAAEWEATQKLKKDVRITRLGHFLRKTSLDELPQLFNVLTGSMSLVGPRPMMVSQRAMYPGSSYYRMRPGITGFWQISDRNECNFGDRAKFDAAYEGQMSFKTDVTVLFRTMFVVFRGTGY